MLGQRGKKGWRAETEEGRKENGKFLFFIFRVFQKYFQMDFEFI